jgi:hypothetical protein
MDMNGIRHKDLGGFKGYCFHGCYLAITHLLPAMTGWLQKTGLPYTDWSVEMK